MKKQTTAIIIGAILGAGIAFAAPPTIDEARINILLEDIQRQQQMQQQMPGAPTPSPEELKANVQRQLQIVEILKNAALNAKLDQDPTVQARFANMQADFYAQAYAEHLAAQIKPTEAELQQQYRLMARQIRLPYVKLADPAQAEQALDLLRKGMDFTTLQSRFPNDSSLSPDQWFSMNQLPPEIASVVTGMQRGQIKPVQLSDGYYIFKLDGERNSPEAPPFAQVKDVVAEQFKQSRVQETIGKLLQENGIDPNANP